MAARSRSSKSIFAPTGDLHSQATLDNPTPNFKALRASGVLICKDYTSSVVDVAGPQHPYSGMHLWFWGGKPYRRIKDLGILKKPTTRMMANSSLTWTSNSPSSYLSTCCAKTGVTNLLIPTSHEWSVKQTELSAAMNTGISSILVSTAELHKTVQMINKAVLLLRHPLINAKNKLRLTRAQLRTTEGRKAMLDMAENDWLEGRYGWRPFIYDTMSWVKAAKSSYSERRTVKDALARITGGPTVVNTVLDFATPSIISYRKEEWSVDLIASCGQTADFKLNLSQFARTWGALDVVGTAWDLLKFSFVLDWFFNLGDTLKALQVYVFIDERIGWNKVSSEGKVKTTWTQPAIGMYGDYEVDYHIGAEVIQCIERVKLTNRKAVDSFLPSLGFSFDLDCAKTLDLLALLHQLARGTKPR